MENQHKKISGYRELTQEEIDLMNEIKAFGPQLESLIAKIGAHINGQYDDIRNDPEALNRISSAHPLSWLQAGTQNLQQGLMAITRAVAQPTFF